LKQKQKTPETKTSSIHDTGLAHSTYLWCSCRLVRPSRYNIEYTLSLDSTSFL